jgi:serine/threonine protein kinase
MKYNLREIEILKSLSETAYKNGIKAEDYNILDYLDVVKEGKTIYLATEYCNGGNLEEYRKKLPKKRLSEREI